jgi:hypothetical protein
MATSNDHGKSNLPTNCYVAASEQFGQPGSHPLWEIARRTNRYFVCDCELGVFEVLDGRRMLDGLLQWQDVRRLLLDEDIAEYYEELLEQQSGGPLLSKADQEILVDLTEIASAYDGAPEQLYYSELWQVATLFKGTEAEARRFLLAKLYWRL